MNAFLRLLRCQAGVSAAEYALILGIIGAAIAIAAMSLGGTIAGSMNSMSDRLTNCQDGSC